MTADVVALWTEALNQHGELVMGRSATNDTPWPRGDMGRFHGLTAGRALVMGRNTYRALPAGMKTPQSLAGRPVVVLCHERSLLDVIVETRIPGPAGWDRVQPLVVTPATTPLDVLLAARAWFGDLGVAVVGGPRVVEFMLDAVDRLEVTVLDQRLRYDGDVPAPDPFALDHDWRLTATAWSGRTAHETYLKQNPTDQGDQK